MTVIVRADPEGEFAEAIRGECAARGFEPPRIAAEPTGGAGIEVLVSGRPPASLLDACPDLQWIVVPFAGLPAETVAALRARPRLSVTNLHHNAAATTETALALLLAAAKRIIPADGALRRGDWSMRHAPDPSPILAGKRALVLGVGAIGSRVARALQALDVSVRGIVREPERSDRLAPAGVPLLPLAALDDELPAADLLIVTLPATPQTDGLLGSSRLKLLPAGSVLVNVGRASIIDEGALHHALVEGSLGAAGIDVWWRMPATEEERTACPPSSLPFADLPNCVLSPHRAGHGAEIEALRARHLLERLAEIERGDARTLDLERGY